MNIDGYIYTWQSSSNRYWRKNRRIINGTNVGIDLNRNFGPNSYFKQSMAATETYSGPYALSEPENVGIMKFLQSIKSTLHGTLDVHTYSGAVLRPFSVMRDNLVGANEEKLRKLADAVCQALQTSNSEQGGHYNYSSLKGYELYKGVLYSGTFKDMVCLEFNSTPSLTIEMAGDDFVAPVNSIRPAGRDLYEAIMTFAKGILEY